MAERPSWRCVCGTFNEDIPEAERCWKCGAAKPTNLFPWRSVGTPFALSVACPTCGCGPNIPCILKYGEPPEPHVERCRLASGLPPLAEQSEQSEAPEAVDHPAHYGGADDPYEAIKVIEAWQLGFNLGNCVKYVSRCEKKGSPLEDLKKAAWYLAREIANREKP